MRRVLITGSRHWQDKSVMRRLIFSLPDDAVVIHGAADGADSMAAEMAKCRGLEVQPYHADWRAYGLAAGPLRNARMIEEGRPTECHAFPLPGSKGTWDCVRKCEAAGIPVTVHQ